MMSSIRSMLIRGICLSMIWMAASATLHAGLEQYLIAKWDFTKGSLDSEVGGFKLTATDAGSDTSMEFQPAGLRLGGGKFLYCSDINSTKYPNLTKGVTIWAKVKIDGDLKLGSFIFGFTNLAKPGNWENMCLTAMYGLHEEKTFWAPFGKLPDNKDISVGSSRFIFSSKGEDLTIAVTFDGASNTMTMWANGKTAVEKKKDAVAIKDFTGLALGRLKESSAIPIIFKEVRIYSTPLTAEWIDEISSK